MIFLKGNSILAKEYAAGILVNKTPITIIELIIAKMNPFKIPILNSLMILLVKLFLVCYKK